MIAHRAIDAIVAESAKSAMDKKAQIKEQLRVLGRGAQARLAAYLGVTESVLSKTLSSNLTRKLGDTEATRIQEWLAKQPIDAGSYAPMHDTPSIRQPTVPVTVPRFGQKKSAQLIVVNRTAPGGRSGGDFTMYPNEVAHRLRRPDEWSERLEIFGLYVVGDTMAPRFISGEIIFVEPIPIPKANDWIVLEMQPDPDGSVGMYLKKYLRQDVDNVTVQQLNPDKTDEIPRSKVSRFLRVLSMEDLLTRPT